MGVVLRLLKTRPQVDAQTPEGAVVESARSGDAKAFSELFTRFAPDVRRFSRDLLRDDAAADEATQETFVRAHLLLPRLEQPPRVKAWLLGIARNVAFEARRLGPTVAVPDDDELPIEAVLPGPDPLSVLMDKELEDAFQAALGELPAHRRAALVLRLDHGLAYDDIAEAMGWTLPMVKNEIHRARLGLRRALVPHLSTGRAS